MKAEIRLRADSPCCELKAAFGRGEDYSSLASFATADTEKLLPIENLGVTMELYILEVLHELRMLHQKMAPSDYIAVTAGFVSVLSFGVTVYQGYLARQHNRLSVRPHLDCMFYTIFPEPSSIVLENHGIGTAIIECITFSVKGASYKLTRSGLSGFLSSLPPEIVPECQYYFMGGQTCLRAGSSLKLLSIGNHEKSTTRQGQCVDLFSKIEITIEYRSMYGQRFLYEKKPLVS